MKFMVAICIVWLAVLPPQISAAQNPTVAAKFFCPQCGFENKAAARFCPQCGTSLPKLTPMPLPLFSSIQPSDPSASAIDSAALARRELIRELVADPEFTRALQQQIQNTAPAGQVVQQKTSAARPKPVRDFFTIIGGLTCTVVFLGLAFTL
jgi:predicted amidophosphoribosyltransferase